MFYVFVIKSLKMEQFVGALKLVWKFSSSYLISRGTICRLFFEFDFFISSPNFLVLSLKVCNFVVIGDKLSANLMSWFCFEILVLNLRAGWFFCYSVNLPRFIKPCSVTLE